MDETGKHEYFDPHEFPGRAWEVFSRSPLWALQERYFAESGIEAWRQGAVPHYITSNPTLANSYAEIIFAARRDQERLGPGKEPVYVCELGAGSGRFAFHFLKRLTRLCEQSSVAPGAFRYVLACWTSRCLTSINQMNSTCN